jgi:hypothetical protein
MYVGIDNGVNGGIVIIDKEARIVYKTPMPVLSISKSNRKEYDIQTISKIFKQYLDDEALVILEKAQPRFRDGTKQAFKTGYGYGVIQGILVALGVNYEIVAPKVWQKKIFKGNTYSDTKMASAMFCKMRWAEEKWTATERSKKIHDGMTDAACMAYYGLLEFKINKIN